MGKSPYNLQRADTIVLSTAPQAKASIEKGLNLPLINCYLSIQSALKQVPNRYCCLIPTVLSCPCIAGLAFPSYKSLTGYRAPGFAISASQTIFELVIDVITKITNIFLSIFLCLVFNFYNFPTSIILEYYKLFFYQMKRYFYTGNLITKKWLDGQFNLIRMQDKIYRDALLAALKLQPTKVKKFKELRETFLNMTIQQQRKYANNYHMQALFKHFDSLHRNTRGKSMIVRGKQSLVRDLVDPDKFPVWDLKKRPNVFYSIWNTVMGKVRYDFGHQLTVKNSLIQHPQGGRGIFVQLSAHKKQIQVGELLGLIPGSIYQSYQSFKKFRLDKLQSYQNEPQHLHFPSGKVLELCQYKYYDSLTRTEMGLQPCMINPYSLGQFVNHPPYGKKPNVIFTQIQCNKNFFPSYMTSYLPYNSYLPEQNKKKNEKITVFAIFACQPITQNSQLYVDYCQNHIYPIDKIPEWMNQPDYQNKTQPSHAKQPNPYDLNFSKQQYQHPSPIYWTIIQKQALKKNEQLYNKYMNVIKYRPNNTVYEDEQVKISTMETNVRASEKINSRNS